MALPIGRRRQLVLLGGTWFLLALLFGIWDLPITRWAADTSSGWGVFVDRWGAFPGLLVILWALLLLAARSLGGSGAKSGAAGGLYTLLAMAALGYLGAASAMNVGVPAGAVAARGWLIWLVSGAVATALVVLLHREGTSPGPETLLAARGVVLLAALAWLLFVQPLKLLWGRVRFYDLVPPDFAAFTPWYLPQGSTGHFSFPSGHTAMGWMLLALLLLVSDRSRGVRAAVWAGVVGWGLFVAAGRVRYGAHYPSDVLFPTGMAFLIMLLFSSSAPPSRTTL